MSCEHQYVSTRKTKFITGPGLFGSLLFLAGIPALAFGVLPGVVLMVLGIAIGMVGRKAEVILCAKCGEKAPHQP